MDGPYPPIQNRQECRTEIEVSYKTEYAEACETVTKSECHPVVKQVPDKKCHTAYEKACSTHYETTYVHSYAEKCKPVHKEASHTLAKSIWIKSNLQ